MNKTFPKSLLNLLGFNGDKMYKVINLHHIRRQEGLNLALKYIKCQHRTFVKRSHLRWRKKNMQNMRNKESGRTGLVSSISSFGAHQVHLNVMKQRICVEKNQNLQHSSTLRWHEKNYKRLRRPKLIQERLNLYYQRGVLAIKAVSSQHMMYLRQIKLHNLNTNVQQPHQQQGVSRCHKFFLTLLSNLSKVIKYLKARKTWFYSFNNKFSNSNISNLAISWTTTICKLCQSPIRLISIFYNQFRTFKLNFN